MTYSVTFDPTRKRIDLVQSGPDNGQHAVLESMREVRLDPRFRPEYGILWDFRNGTVQLSSLEAYGYGTVYKQFFKGQKVAYVIPAALTRMAQKHALAAAPEVEIRDFQDITSAEAWLGNALTAA